MRWPAFTSGAAETVPQPDMPYAGVLARCVFPRRADEDPRLDAWTQCTTDLNQSIKELARAGELQVWGRYTDSGPLIPIPAGHWGEDAEIDPAQASRGRAICRGSTIDADPAWHDLTFDRRQVRRNLPSKWIGSFRVLSCGYIKP